MIRLSNRPNRIGRNFHPAIFIAAAFLCLAASGASAQEAGPAPKQTIRVASDVVRISASVLDKKGNFVTGLEEANFRVLDNGAPQPILSFAPMDAPAEVLVLVETSPAVYLFHEEYIGAAYALLEGLSPEDEVALATYDDAPHPLLGFAPDKTALLEAIGRIQYGVGMGQLNFYDSVSTVLDWLPPSASKRALVLLTTGLDSSNSARWDALVHKLRTKDVVIYSVALGGSLRNPSEKKSKPKSKGKSKAKKEQQNQSVMGDEPASGPSRLSFAQANQDLRSLAEITGGRAYFPASPEEFVSIYREIAATLRHQYVLAIAPAQDGQFHGLKVEVLRPNGDVAAAEGENTPEKVFARQGYLAPNQ
ncbi:MAG TPA: VWA domain-containing protein [Candidatus Acidoferrales bacterium]|nr:VWA domain-containing protein [Candidatus Acidoferrales bacterium]